MDYKPICNVRGMLPGGMCSRVIVGGTHCAHKGECQHKETPKQRLLFSLREVHAETGNVLEHLSKLSQGGGNG